MYRVWPEQKLEASEAKNRTPYADFIRLTEAAESVCHRNGVRVEAITCGIICERRGPYGANGHGIDADSLLCPRCSHRPR